MDQQKILWITLSIAVLLLAVLGSALFIFGPSAIGREQGAISSDSKSDNNQFDPIEWARTGSEYPTLNDITPSENNEDGFVVSAEGSDLDKDKITISDDNKDSGKAVVSLPVKKVEQPKVSSADSNIKKSEPTAKKPADKTSASKTVKSVKEYWIQTNSFSTIARAEEERKVITAKGFPAVVQTKVSGDKTFYRVRVGSYSTRAEAEKFLYWIKDIKGFEGSQIYEVTAQREM
ncbi:MAG: SPOR domain-containing protein [Spirochaetaceae bacterium]|nr:SPOR domain-containing protein [Spirochaetaceae bacterium]